MSKLTATTAMLMTPDEKALFRASESRLIYKVGDAELRAQIERARHLRKKYDDLLQRERAAAQKAGAEPGSRAAKGNSNTVRKATAFTYVVSQFEAETDRRAGAIAPAKGSKDSSEGTKATRSSNKKPSEPASASTKTTKAGTTHASAAASGSKGKFAAPKKASSKKSASRSAADKGAKSPAPRAKPNAVRPQRTSAGRQVGHTAARRR